MDATIVFVLMGVVAGFFLGLMVGLLVGNRRGRLPVVQNPVKAVSEEKKIDERLASMPSVDAANSDRPAVAARVAPRVEQPDAMLEKGLRKTGEMDRVKEESLVKSKSIVEQIDEILQKKLAASATENRAIRLVESQNKGVVVWVGLQHYNGIDEVPDPEVIALIRSAVAEWEQLTGSRR